MSSSNQQTLSAAVTRILIIEGFPPELKTRDLQAAFSPWEGDKGGFKVKWIDDQTAMLVFADASTAKRAYLTSLLHPPSTLLPVTPPSNQLKLRPYDGADAHTIIQSIQSRHQPGGSVSSMPIAQQGGGGFRPGHSKNTSSITSSFVPPPGRGHGRSSSTSSLVGSGSFGGYGTGGMGMFGRSNSSSGQDGSSGGGERGNGSGSWSRSSIPSVASLPPLQAVSGGYPSFQSSLSPVAPSPINSAPPMRFGMSSPPLSQETGSSSSNHNSSGEEDLKAGGARWGHRSGSSSVNWGNLRTSTEARKSLSGGY